MVFATIGVRTPVGAIVLQAFLVWSIHIAAIHEHEYELVFADIEEKDASNASSIASTMQQMSISFGVAAAGLSHSAFRSQHTLRSDRIDSGNP
jgi:hypothetical protein